MYYVSVATIWIMRNSTIYNFCNLWYISSAINLFNNVIALSKCLYFCQSQKSNRESSHRNEKTVNHGVGGDGEMDDQDRQNIFKSSGGKPMQCTRVLHLWSFYYCNFLSLYFSGEFALVKFVWSSSACSWFETTLNYKLRISFSANCSAV